MNDEGAIYGKIPRYPYYSYEDALKIGAAVKSLGGANGLVTRAMLASKLGAREDSSSFAQRISSAKSFGIIQGDGNFSLTQAGQKYFSPVDQVQPKLALVAFIKNPPVYKRVIGQYDGAELPPIALLKNWLEIEKLVPPSWAERVAQIFHGAAQNANVTQNGILRIKATEDTLRNRLENNPWPVDQEASGNEESVSPAERPRADAIFSPPPPPTGAKNSSDIIVWQLGGVYLRAPINMDEKVWKMLEMTVQGLKPPSAQ